MPKLNEKKRKELYYELRELDAEIKKFNTHLETLDEQVAELDSSKTAVAKFTELSKGNEMRVPLSSGIYVKTTLADPKKLMINVGVGVAVEKTPEQVLAILQGQIDELTSYRTDLVGQMKIMIARIEKIQKEFE
ncbi:MAG: prefoldin subunit alpha [archaeon]